jgi:hypothetical protein
LATYLFPLTKDEFGAWLSKQDPKAIVGTACDGDDCPIAKCLQAQGHRQAWIGEKVYCLSELGSYSNNLMLPDWAVKFAEDLDLKFMTKDVTAAQALGLL